MPSTLTEILSRIREKLRDARPTPSGRDFRVPAATPPVSGSVAAGSAAASAAAAPTVAPTAPAPPAGVFMFAQTYLAAVVDSRTGVISHYQQMVQYVPMVQQIYNVPVLDSATGAFLGYRQMVQYVAIQQIAAPAAASAAPQEEAQPEPAEEATRSRSGRFRPRLPEMQNAVLQTREGILGLGDIIDPTLEVVTFILESIRRSQEAAAQAAEAAAGSAESAHRALLAGGGHALPHVTVQASAVAAVAGTSAGLGLILGVNDLFQSVKESVRLFGRQRASISLIKILKLQKSIVKRRPDLLQSTANYQGILIREYMADGSSAEIQGTFLSSEMSLYLHWMLYKYRANIISEIGDIAPMYITSLLGIAAGVLSVIVAASLGTISFGAVPVILSLTAAGISLSAFLYNSIKHLQGHIVFKDYYEQGIISEEDKEAMKGIFGREVRTMVGGLTISDWFRFRIANMLCQIPDLGEGDARELDLEPLVRQELTASASSGSTSDVAEKILILRYLIQYPPMPYSPYNQAIYRYQLAQFEAEARLAAHAQEEKIRNRALIYSLIAHGMWQMIKSSTSKKEAKETMEEKDLMERRKRIAKLII